MSTTTAIKVTFVTEIMQMMHAFGDGLRSNPDTAYLIEEIVHQQMKSLLVKTVDIAIMRQAGHISLEDILFALRKDKIKLCRLYNNLHLKDTIDRMNRIVSTGGQFQPASHESLSHTSASNDHFFGSNAQNPSQSGQLSSKRVKICRNFFTAIDETGEYENLLSDELQDEIKYTRKLRQEELSRTLSESDYDKFCECRRVSFSPPKKFEMWLLDGHIEDGVDMSDLKIHQFALEAFAYLAYETVGEIVDMCLLVRQAAKNEPGNEVPALVSLKKKPTKATHSSFQTACTQMQGTMNNMHAAVPPVGPGHHQVNSSVLGPSLQQQEQLMNPTISPADVIEVVRRSSCTTLPLTLLNGVLS